MPNTYVALRTETVVTPTSTITFSNIPQDYTDLVLVFQATGASVNMNWDIRVGNGTVDSGSNYSATYIVGGSGGASSNRVSNQTAMRLGFSAYIQASGGNFMAVTQIMNYSNTTTNKTVISRDGNVNLGAEAAVGLWRSTSAINIITLGDFGGATMAAGTTATLYGIANADQGAAKATGGIITEDSQYWYHTFAASGAFIPKQSLTCDILQIAGGGGGGADMSGGGGAGGLLYFASQSLTAISHNVTVGAGGSGSTGGGTLGTNGVNSQFAALTASVGGGRSGNYLTPNGASGGSGGGGGRNTGGSSGGAPTTGQGFAGGGGNRISSDGETGGGGGAGAVGQTGSTGFSGDGGVGLTTYSSWGVATGTGENVSGTVYYAGGGGGGWQDNSTVTGAGGFGGGGSGASSTVVSTAGLANTGGGGGGGAGAGSAGRAGGSGVVIVRYAK